MIKKCIGCGVVLQNTDETKLGYTPILNNKAKYCMRCFRLINYNEASIIDVVKHEEKVIDEVNKKANLAVFIIDFLNINSEVINKFNKIKSNKILVVNKLDIIPKSIKESKILDWLRTEYKIKEEVLFLSAKKGSNINKLINKIEGVKHTYFLGFTNSGKSTLLNKICSKYEVVNKMITTSPIPNTTLDFINIKISDNCSIIDTPGFTYQDKLYQNDELDFIKKINPKSFLKPITYQLKPMASVVVENKFRIENVSDLKLSFTLYISNDLNVKVLFSNNNNLYNLDSNEIKIEENNDLVIKNIGFVNIKNECNLKIYSDNLKVFEKRNSLF